MKISLKRISIFIPSVIFFIMIFIPFVSNWNFCPQDGFSFENVFSNEFPKKFDQLYQNHIPGRDAILSRYAALRRDLFKVNEKVIFGEKDWLFYKAEGDGNTISDFTGTNLFNEDQLRAFVKEARCTREWLKAPGARVLMVIPPNKSQVYSELMPEIYRREKAKTGRHGQVEAALQSQGFDIVSVKASLIDSKGLGQLYYRTDSHWNSLGAAVAFSKLIAALEPGVAFTPEWKEVDYFCGDIYTNMLGLKESCKDIDYIDQSGAISWISLNCEKDRNNSNNKDILRKCINPQSKSRKTVLLIGDSYFDALAPYFASYYQKVYSLDRKKNKSRVREVLDTEKPDIVVIEAVERYIPEMFSFSDCE